jgi:hypothetical protein
VQLKFQQLVRVGIRVNPKMHFVSRNLDYIVLIVELNPFPENRETLIEKRNILSPFGEGPIGATRFPAFYKSVGVLAKIPQTAFVLALVKDHRFDIVGRFLALKAVDEAAIILLNLALPQLPIPNIE